MLRCHYHIGLVQVSLPCQAQSSILWLALGPNWPPTNHGYRRKYRLSWSCYYRWFLDASNHVSKMGCSTFRVDTHLSYQSVSSFTLQKGEFSWKRSFLSWSMLQQLQAQPLLSNRTEKVTMFRSYQKNDFAYFVSLIFLLPNLRSACGYFPV